MPTSSCFHFTTNTTTLWYFVSILSLSCLSATFFALTSCSLWLNSLTIYTYRVLNVFEGSATRSSCPIPSCCPSYALGQNMLIVVIVTNLCRFPYGSIIVLGVVNGAATCGAWFTSVFSALSYVSIIFLSASCVVVIAVIGSDIVF